MRTLLVTMPWHALDCPSLALGVLRAALLRADPQREVSELYANLRWADFLGEASSGRLGPRAYTDVAENGFLHGVGEWVFSGALYGDERWRVEEYRQYLARYGVDADPAIEMQGYASAFVGELADQILGTSPDVVAFTSTFMQNVPSLAVARQLKLRNPAIRTVLGGGNCDGPQGPALHRNFPFIDFVLAGEGERSFPMLIAALEGGKHFDDIPSLSWRVGGRQRVNDPAAAPIPIGEVPAPAFESYFAQLQIAAIRQYVEPKLVLEAARGCWWGEKHQCTFCGLNGSMMKFRSKAPDAFWQELSTMVELYKTLDIIMVDNIIDMHYFETLLPRIHAAAWDVRIHYEVKSNLKREHVAALKGAGVAHIQPGIESLSTRVLDLMQKGVTGPQNVQLLRDCEDHNLTVSWNYLYGFPGETDLDYTPVMEQVPALVHLQPPSGATRIALERFSPNFEAAESLFGDARPAECYSHIYDLTSTELADMVYLYDCANRGIVEAAEAGLHLAITTWQERHSSSYLRAHFIDETIYIDDGRQGWVPRRHVIEGPEQTAAYRALAEVSTPVGISRKLAGRGLTVPMEDLAAWLASWKAAGLIFEDGGRSVALATDAQAIKMRIIA